MIITKLETIRIPEWPNTLWVRLHTDAGLIGLGESFRACDATETYLHSSLAPYLLGKDSRRISQHASAFLNLVGDRFFGFPTRSVELRAFSAVDIALWDLLGQSLGVPMYQCFGGASRERIRAYNTCANATYNQGPGIYGGHLRAPGQQLPATAAHGRYDDYDAAMRDAGSLANDLLESGIDAMKIWPFDSYAVATNGTEISLQEVKRGVAVVESIRKAVGDRMEIMLEYHGRWQLAPALRIAHALRDLDIYWHEEPVAMEQFDDISRFREATGARVAGGESHGTAPWFREVFARGAIDYANFDIGWIGGISEALKVSAVAATYGRAIAPHDCVGPVVLAASMHIVMNAPHAFRQEIVRGYLHGYYKDCVTELPKVEGGYVYPLESPGLGTQLHPALLARSDLIRKTSTISSK